MSSDYIPHSTGPNALHEFACHNYRSNGLPLIREDFRGRGKIKKSFEVGGNALGKYLRTLVEEGRFLPVDRYVPQTAYAPIENKNDVSILRQIVWRIRDCKEFLTQRNYHTIFTCRRCGASFTISMLVPRIPRGPRRCVKCRGTAWSSYYRIFREKSTSAS